MTALQWIIKEAKSLKKKYPKRFKTWKEYVAQASAIYASKHKGKSPVGKKRKKVGAIKKKSAKKVAKKKVAKKVSEYHKDTKSHNVNIRVMSGISGIKKTAEVLLKKQYGELAAKKLTEKTKRGKAAIQKEMSKVAASIKKVHSI